MIKRSVLTVLTASIIFIVLYKTHEFVEHNTNLGGILGFVYFPIIITAFVFLLSILHRSAGRAPEVASAEE